MTFRVSRKSQSHVDSEHITHELVTAIICEPMKTKKQPKPIAFKYNFEVFTSFLPHCYPEISAV